MRGSESPVADGGTVGEGIKKKVWSTPRVIESEIEQTEFLPGVGADGGILGLSSIS